MIKFNIRGYRYGYGKIMSDTEAKTLVQTALGGREIQEVSADEFTPEDWIALARGLPQEGSFDKVMLLIQYSIARQCIDGLLAFD